MHSPLQMGNEENHKSYKLILIEISSGQELEDELMGISDYLRKNTNMYCDHIWELYEELTGMEV